MKPGDVLLIGLALLAVLFFIGGVIDVFSDSQEATRRRRRRRHAAALADSPEDSAAAAAPEFLAPAGEPTSPQESRAIVPPVVAEVSWPAVRPIAVAPARPQAVTGLLERDASGQASGPIDVEQFLPDQLEHGKMVVHYANGRVIKGHSYDFHPNKPLFHLLPPVASSSFADEAVEVRIKELKAVFFVRDFAGDPSNNERKRFPEGERPPGRKVEVTFPDGRVLVGSTVGYDRRRPGFFLIPADPKSNNLKVFVVSRAVTRIRFL